MLCSDSEYALKREIFEVVIKIYVNANIHKIYAVSSPIFRYFFLSKRWRRRVSMSDVNNCPALDGWGFAADGFGIAKSAFRNVINIKHSWPQILHHSRVSPALLHAVECNVMYSSRLCMSLRHVIFIPFSPLHPESFAIKSSVAHYTSSPRLTHHNP